MAHARDPFPVERARRVRAVALDVDGVLTDGTITYSSSGEELKSFNVKDGHGVRLAVEGGLLVFFVTGRSSEAVDRRARELGVTEVVQGALDKGAAMLRIREAYGLEEEELVFVGDDLFDLPAMAQAGLAVAVADAAREVRAFSDWVTTSAGGRGAVREVLERILQAKGIWESVVPPQARAREAIASEGACPTPASATPTTST